MSHSEDQITNKQERFLIVVAGGKGLRFNSTLPKQFTPLAGKPIIIHTIEKFQAAFADIHVIVSLNADYFDWWNEQVVQFPGLSKVDLVAGGESRFESVKNALKTIDQNGLIAVHDAVRPLVSQSLIKKAFKVAEEFPAVVPTIALKSSLRRLEGASSRSVDRSQYRVVQTPQIFHAQVLKQSYDLANEQSFTDDASVVEANAVSVHLIEGEETNFKITYPTDLGLAEQIFAQQ